MFRISIGTFLLLAFGSSCCYCSGLMVLMVLTLHLRPPLFSTELQGFQAEEHLSRFSRFLSAPALLAATLCNFHLISTMWWTCWGVWTEMFLLLPGGVSEGEEKGSGGGVRWSCTSQWRRGGTERWFSWWWRWWWWSYDSSIDGRDEKLILDDDELMSEWIMSKG